MTESVAVTTIDSPVGPLLLAATSRGLLQVHFQWEDVDDSRRWIEDHIGPLDGEPGWLGAPVAQLREYFAGDRRRFDLALDRRLSSGFRKEAQDAMAMIPYGQVMSYAEVAATAGRPRAVRAVGSACATNPLPLVIPCHRVVRSDGSMGGFAGGVKTKEALLALERSHLG